jgi:hypothetical protein
MLQISTRCAPGGKLLLYRESTTNVLASRLGRQLHLTDQYVLPAARSDG